MLGGENFISVTTDFNEYGCSQEVANVEVTENFKTNELNNPLVVVISSAIHEKSPENL